MHAPFLASMVFPVTRNCGSLRRVHFGLFSSISIQVSILDFYVILGSSRGHFVRETLIAEFCCLLCGLQIVTIKNRPSKQHSSRQNFHIRRSDPFSRTTRQLIPPVAVEWQSSSILTSLTLFIRATRLDVRSRFSASSRTTVAVSVMHSCVSNSEVHFFT